MSDILVTIVEEVIEVEFPTANIPHTHAISEIEDLEDELSGKSDVGHTHEIEDVNGLEDALEGKASLDGSGKIPSSQLPAYVDDILEYANLAAFPAIGTSGIIYVDIEHGLTYRRTGSTYVEISQSLALGETAQTAYRGDRGKMAYDHSQTTGNPHGTTKSDIGLGTVDNTSDLSKPISTATQTALDLKSNIGHTHDDRYYTDSEVDVFLVAKVSGPASATDNALVRFDGPTGKLVKNSGILIDDSNNITGVLSLAVSNAGNGLAFFNTADQVTNYERVRMLYLSNTFYIVGGNAGSGVSRSISIGTNATGADALPSNTRSDWTASTINHTIRSTSSNGVGHNFSIGNNTASNGSEDMLVLSATVSHSGVAGYTAIKANVVESSTGSGAKNLLLLQTSGVTKFAVDNSGRITFDTTITAIGTTGNQTINKPSGTVNIAAGASSITVTNSLVTANSIVCVVIRTNDTTAVIKNVVPTAGSFTITLSATATATTSVGFVVIN